MQILEFLSLLSHALKVAGKKAIIAIKKILKQGKVTFENLSDEVLAVIQSVIIAYDCLTPGQKVFAKIILGLLAVGVAVGLIIGLVKILGPISAVATFISWAWWLYNMYAKDSNTSEENEGLGGSSEEELLRAGCAFD